MHVHVVDDLGDRVGQLWLERQAQGPMNGAAPLSSTPLPLFRWVIDHAAEFEPWESVGFVLMDEQVDGSTEPFIYVASDDPASYEGFARRNLLHPLSAVTRVELPVIKPDLSSVDTFEVDIDLLILAIGPSLILAIGPSGNYANVMPGTPLTTGWHIAELTEEFRTAHTQTGSDSYEGARFRTHGMSLGPQQVLGAGQVVVIARGAAKAPLVDRLLSTNSFDASFPISIVHHPKVSDRVQVFLAEDAR